MAAEDRPWPEAPPDIVARIQKCMALEARADVHEAAAATQAVQRLLAAYHLTRQDIVARSIVEADLPGPPPRGWRLMLLGLLGRTFACRVTAPHGKAQLRVFGEASNVHSFRTAYTTYEALIRRWRKEGWRAHVAELTDPVVGVHPIVQEPGARRAWKTSFTMGALMQLARLLRGEEYLDPAGAATSETGLLRICDFRDRQLALVDAWLHQRGYRVRSSTDVAATLLPSVLRRGQAAVVKGA